MQAIILRFDRLYNKNARDVISGYPPKYHHPDVPYQGVSDYCRKPSEPYVKYFYVQLSYCEGGCEIIPSANLLLWPFLETKHTIHLT